MKTSGRTPWGFTRARDGHLVATTATADRARRAELGETAIRVLGVLGIEPWHLEVMEDLDESGLLHALQRRAGAPVRPQNRQLEFDFAQGDQR